MRAIIAWSWGSLRVGDPDTSSGGGSGGPGQGIQGVLGGDLGGPDPSLPRGLGVLTPDPGDQVARTLQDHGSRRVDLSGLEGSGGYPGNRRFSAKKRHFRGSILEGDLGGFWGVLGVLGGTWPGPWKTWKKRSNPGYPKIAPKDRSLAEKSPKSGGYSAKCPSKSLNSQIICL